MRVVLLACAIVITALGCRKDDRATPAILLERGELIVGTEPEFPPFESIDEHGEYVGFDMDLARELAKDLGVRLRIEPMAFDSLPTALATGKIDVIISGMTATEERRKSRAFTEPYFLTGLCLLVNANSGIEKAADVNGKRVVVKLGTTGDINAPRLFKDIEITRLDTEGACALEVVQGRADAFLYDQLSILRHHKRNPKTTRALLKPLTKEPYAMACRLGDREFLDRLNAFLETIRADGRYDRIYAKHFAELPDGSR
jgi:polar amino acid transport system substrate-binding protein